MSVFHEVGFNWKIRIARKFRLFDHSCSGPVSPSPEMDNSRKYPYLYHGRLLGFPTGSGVHDFGILRAWWAFTTGNQKAWGHFTGGISGVESVE